MPVSTQIVNQKEKDDRALTFLESVFKGCQDLEEIQLNFLPHQVKREKCKALGQKSKHQIVALQNSLKSKIRRIRVSCRDIFPDKRCYDPDCKWYNANKGMYNRNQD